MRIAFVLILATLLSGLAGCSLLVGRDAAPEPIQGVAVLIDVTSSTANIRERYITEFQKLLQRLGENVRLVVLQVDSNSASRPVVFEHTFRAPHWLWENPHKIRVANKKAREEALSSVRRLLNAPPPDRTGTTIIDGIGYAARLLSSYPPGHREIVVISDMAEQSELVDLTQGPLDSPDRVLDRLQAQGRLSNLGGTCLHATGVTDGDGPNGWMTPEQVAKIKAFWHHFVDRTGAKLRAYGPSLLDFTPCDR